MDERSSGAAKGALGKKSKTRCARAAPAFGRQQQRCAWRVALRSILKCCCSMATPRSIDFHCTHEELIGESRRFHYV